MSHSTVGNTCALVIPSVTSVRGRFRQYRYRLYSFSALEFKARQYLHAASDTVPPALYGVLGRVMHVHAPTYGNWYQWPHVHAGPTPYVLYSPWRCTKVSTPRTYNPMSTA